MGRNVLLLGSGEIGSYLKGRRNVVYKDFKTIKNVDVSLFSTVINCTFDPAYYDENKTLDKLFDEQIIQLAKDNKNVHFIFLSTRMIFGNSKLPFTELSPYNKNPISEYARKKIILERKLKYFENITIVRLPNIISARTQRNRFFGMMLSSFKENNRLEFDFSLDEYREFVWANDVADFLLFLSNLNPIGPVNFSYVQKYTVREFVSIFTKVFGKCLCTEGRAESGLEFTFDTRFLMSVYPEIKHKQLEFAMEKIHQSWIKL